MAVHVFFTYPETAQKSLEEIDLLFNGEIKPWRSSKVRGFDSAVQERRQSGGKSGDGVLSDSDKSGRAAHNEQV